MHHGHKGKVDKAEHFWPTCRRLLAYLRPWRLGVTVSVLFAIISTVFSIFAPKVLGQATTLIYQGVIKGYAQIKAGKQLTELPVDFAGVFKIGLWVIALYLISSVFSFGQQIIMTRISQQVVYHLRADFKEKMRHVPVAYYDTHSKGDLMSRMVNDMDNISGTLQQTLIQLITSAITLVGTLAIMLTISWKLTLVALLTVPFSLLITATIAPRAQKLFGRQQEQLGKINGQVEEIYAGVGIVRVFNQEANEEAAFADHNDAYFDASWKAEFLSIMIFPLMNFVKNVGYLLIAVFGVIDVIGGAISLGNVQAFLQYSNQFSQPLTQLANMSSTIQQTIASAERIFAVLDAGDMDENLHPAPEIATSAKLVFRDVSFSYTDASLIEDFSLEVPKGEMVAIVGPTGAGKTTIINLLERFYDVASGQIYLDGKETRAMSREDLRSHIAMVLQDTWLFTGTIFENIKYGRESASDEEVYQAARLARADGFIRQLPDGYQTVLNEEASNISQGQRQLLT
ncbi:ABC transporter ATP-binding protein, partial [Lactobacillus nasalidis]